MITSATNPAVKAARRLRRRYDRQRAGGDFLVEGAHVLREALPHLRRVFVTEAGLAAQPDLGADLAAQGVAVVEVSEGVLATITDTVTPQGMVGVAALPPSRLAAVLCRATEVHSAAGAGTVVVCEQVRDPGNLGAIVRSADAAGAAALVVTSASVDVRNPKAVRASAGSVFHLPIVEGVSLAEVATACRSCGVTLVAASADGPVPHTDVDFVAPTAVVFGNETHGLGAEALGACDLVASVPLYGPAESLNLAASAAVILYEAARQREVVSHRTLQGRSA